MKLKTTSHRPPFVEEGQPTDLPPDLVKRLIPWATSTCLQYSFGVVLYQEYAHTSFDISSCYCVFQNNSPFYMLIKKKAIALICLEEGQVTIPYNQTSDRQVSAPGSILAYLSARHLSVRPLSSSLQVSVIRFRKKFYTSLVNKLAFLPTVEALENKDAERLPPAGQRPLSPRMIAELYKMKHSVKEGYSLDIELNYCIINLLEAYAHFSVTALQMAKKKAVPQEQLLVHLYNAIYETGNFHDKDISGLAREKNMSARTLRRNFKALFGISLRSHIGKTRMDHAYQLVHYSDRPLSEISEQLRYTDVLHFTNSFYKKFKITPSRLREAMP